MAQRAPTTKEEFVDLIARTLRSRRADGLRKCVSNHYFSRRSPTGKGFFNITAFSAPPRPPLRRLWSWIDTGARQAARRIQPDGLGQVDVYKGPPR